MKTGYIKLRKKSYLYSGLCICVQSAVFYLIGNSSEFPMRQNAPLRCAARRWEDRFAILLARRSSAALTGRIEGMGESKSACGLCYGKIVT